MSPSAGSPAFDVTRYQDPLIVQRVIFRAKTIALIGLSPNELRASYFVAYYLKRHGYRVIPVNPRETSILGERCYATLADVQEPIDIVDVFRTPDALPGIAAEAVQIKGRWDVVLADFQLGPGPNGLDFLEMYRARGVVLALLTANVSDAVLSRATTRNASANRPAAVRARYSGTCCSIGQPPCSQGAVKQSVRGSGDEPLRDLTFSRCRLWVRGSASTRATRASTASGSMRWKSPITREASDASCPRRA